VIHADAPPGTPLEVTELALEPIEQALRELPPTELKQFVSTTGVQNAAGLIPVTGSHYAEIFVYLTPPELRARSNDEIIEAITQRVGSPPLFKRVQYVRVGPMLASGDPIQVSIQANDFVEGASATHELKSYLSVLPGVHNVADTYQMGKKTVSLNINALASTASAIAPEDVGNVVRGAYNGLIPTKVWQGSEEVPIRVTLQEKDRANPATLSKLKALSPNGVLVPIHKLATANVSNDLAMREHFNGRRQLLVTADVDPNLTDPLTVSHQLRPFLKTLQSKHLGVVFMIGGDAAATDEGLNALLVTFIISLFAILFVLIMTYQRVSHALLSFVSIPLGFMAATWAFALHGKPFTFLGVMGMIALCGVIVNQAVTFLDFIRHFRSLGENRWQSLVSTGRLRLKPIFLTTATTVAGVLPTAYGIGGGDSFVTYIALALSWGLGLGTLLMLFAIPVGVALLDDLAEVKLRRPSFKWWYREKPVALYPRP